MNKNPYEVLGVARNANDDEIKKAYHKLVMKYHPDRNPGDKDAEEKFKEVNNAFDILKDPQKRAAYDRFGDAAFAGGNASGANPFGAGGNPFGNGAFHFNMGGGAGMDDILREAMRGFGFDMGGGASRRDSQRRGRDLLDEVVIDLRDAYFGVQDMFARRVDFLRWRRLVLTVMVWGIKLIKNAVSVMVRACYVKRVRWM